MASNLFDFVAKAKQFATKHTSARREAQRLENALNEYTDGRGSKYAVEQAIRRFETIAGEQTIREHGQRGGSGRLGVTGQAAQFIGRITSKLGKLGQTIQKLFGDRQEGYEANQVKAASQMLEMYNLQDIHSNAQEYTAKIAAAISSLEDHNWSIDAAMDTVEQASKDPQSGHLEDIIQPRYGGSQQQSGRRSAIDEENTPRLSKLHTTPGSSNVYSFQYDYLTSTVFVRYKAPAINTGAVTNYKSAGGMRAMAGDMGNTIMGKTDAPGPLYAYYDVPVSVFRDLVRASSAGGAVWDDLRQRGSVHGHQFRYGLAEGAEVPGEGGKMATYVPRRATKLGFASRSVATPGAGKRRYVSSTLPQDKRGHSTIMAMRHRPGRGSQPNRGRPEPPNRGR